MNNKILELAKQSGLEHISPDKLETFAQLIIDECVDICDHSIRQNSLNRSEIADVTMKNIYNYSVKTVESIKGNIKEHFDIQTYD